MLALTSFVQAAPSSGQPLSAEQRFFQTIKWENLANNGIEGSIRPFAVEYYEVPERLVNFKWVRDLPDSVRRSLVFQKSGESHVRWIIQPTDTQWHKEIASLLKAQGLDATPRNGALKGYTSSSRSIFISDRKNGAFYSVKVSTDNAPGRWPNKPVRSSHLHELQSTNEFLKETGTSQLPRLDLMTESMLLGIDSVNQGLSVRDYSRFLDNGDTLLLPAFGALHSELAVEIAVANGASDPKAFWMENYAKPIGAAMAENMAENLTALRSTHNQNLMIELDSSLRPTGRFIGRDFTGSTSAHATLFEAAGRPDLLKKWKGEVLDEHYRVRVGFIHGTSSPVWLERKAEIEVWNAAFLQSFVSRLAELTGIPKNTILKAYDRALLRDGATEYVFRLSKDSRFWEQFIRFVRTKHSGKKMSSQAKGPVITSHPQASADLVADLSNTSDWEKHFKRDPLAALQQLLRRKILGQDGEPMERLVSRLSAMALPKPEPQLLRTLVALGSSDPRVLQRAFETLDEPGLLAITVKNSARAPVHDRGLQSALARLKSSTKVNSLAAKALQAMETQNPKCPQVILDAARILD